MRRAPPHPRKTKAPVLAKQKLLSPKTSALELVVNKFLPNQSQEESPLIHYQMSKRRNKSTRRWLKKQLVDVWETVKKNDKFYSFIFLVAQAIVLQYVNHQ